MSDSISSELEIILSKFDNADEPFEEYEVTAELRRLLPSDNKDVITMGPRAEFMAFEFLENSGHQETNWGTYYGPMLVMSNPDGTTTESPSIQKVTPEILKYWEERAESVIHPVLKYRYANLVWDLSKKITNESANIHMAHVVIDNAIQIAENDLKKHPTDIIKTISRSLSIAIQINDRRRIESVKETVFRYEEKVSEDTKPGLWAFLHELLLQNKKVGLKDRERDEIINRLEDRLERLSRLLDGSGSYVWATEVAAVPLAIHFRKYNRTEEVRRVLLKYGSALEKASENVAALVALTWLENLHRIYNEFGLQSDAANLSVKLRALGPKFNAEMKRTSHSTEIPREEMERFVDSILQGTMEESLFRTARYFTPTKDEAKKQLQENSKKFIFQFLTTQYIQDHKGRTQAIIGTLNDDLDGHIVRRISENMQFQWIYLSEVLIALVKKYNVNTDKLLSYIFTSPLFSDDKKTIIEAGIKAYLEDNDLVSIHLLIPQIEDAIRNLIEYSGGSILKPLRNGGFQLKTFDELLRDQCLINTFNDDIALYFRILFTDPRGWNMRNNVCHGISPGFSFGPPWSDRIIHTLLCLAIVREKKI